MHNVAQEAVVLAQLRVVRLADQAQQTGFSRVARPTGYWVYRSILNVESLFSLAASLTFPAYLAAWRRKFCASSATNLASCALASPCSALASSTAPTWLMFHSLHSLCSSCTLCPLWDMSDSCLQNRNPSKQRIQWNSNKVVKQQNCVSLPILVETCKRARADNNCIRNCTRGKHCDAANQWVRIWP